MSAAVPNVVTVLKKLSTPPPYLSIVGSAISWAGSQGTSSPSPYARVSSCSRASSGSPVRSTWRAIRATRWARTSGMLTTRDASPSGCSASRWTFTGGRRSSSATSSRKIMAALLAMTRFQATVDDERRVGLVPVEHLGERPPRRRHLGRVDRPLAVDRREPAGHQQRVPLPQRNVEPLREPQDHLPAGPGPPGLDETEMPCGHLRDPGEIQLAEPPPPPPVPQKPADRTRTRDHGRTLSTRARTPAITWEVIDAMTRPGETGRHVHS